MSRFIILALLLPLSACGRKVHIVSPNESIADADASQAVMASIAANERKLLRDGVSGISFFGEPVIAAKTMVFLPNKDEQWTEEWQVQRNGYRVAYEVIFITQDTGKTLSEIELPPVRLQEAEHVRKPAFTQEQLREKVAEVIRKQVDTQWPELDEAARAATAAETTEGFLLQLRDLTPGTIEKLRKNPFQFKSDAAK